MQRNTPSTTRPTARRVPARVSASVAAPHRGLRPVCLFAKSLQSNPSRRLSQLQRCRQPMRIRVDQENRGSPMNLIRTSDDTDRADDDCTVKDWRAHDLFSSLSRAKPRCCTWRSPCLSRRTEADRVFVMTQESLFTNQKRGELIFGQVCSDCLANGCAVEGQMFADPRLQSKNCRSRQGLIPVANTGNGSLQIF